MKAECIIVSIHIKRVKQKLPIQPCLQLLIFRNELLKLKILLLNLLIEDHPLHKIRWRYKALLLKAGEISQKQWLTKARHNEIFFIQIFGLWIQTVKFISWFLKFRMENGSNTRTHQKQGIYGLLLFLFRQHKCSVMKGRDTLMYIGIQLI